ncbi:MAG: S8 family serine peptidase, partial [Bacteroidota bacterium]
MRSIRMLFPFSLVILMLAAVSAFSASKTGTRLHEYLMRVNPSDEILVWVFFHDKGSSEILRDAIPASVVSDRSLQRRLKVRSHESVVDYSDLPVEESYVQQISQSVLRIRQRSKWFNAVSVVATEAQLQHLATLPFVREMEMVTRFKKEYDVVESQSDMNSSHPPQETESILDLDYGAALNQVQQINVPVVHNAGNFAQNVVIAVFDNGFRLLSHESFADMNIIATYDFVDHKVSVIPNNPSTAFGSHGVNTLSTIGGYKPGQLIGPAFGASFILVRTENDSSETPAEEDYWLAGIEWADSIGVDVTSTSLGYLDYDSPFPSWTWQNMNGNTTLITRAADMAAGRGILVVNSAGNNGSNASRNTLGAPADGDSVVAIGAVNAGGTRSSISSVGPTTSIPARIKPDLMAQGS